MDYGTASVDVSSWARESGFNDKNLNNFSQYSRNFYGTMIYTKIVSRLAITDSFEKTELKQMGETYKNLYLRYYEGVKDVASEEIKNSPGFKLWLSSETAPSQKNVLRLANTNGEENNKLHIPMPNNEK